jgi:hypothetical protein
VDETLGGRVLVMGGAMGDATGWVCEVKTVNNVHYMTLRNKLHLSRLASMAAVPGLAGNAVLKQLKNERANKCQAIIMEMFEKSSGGVKKSYHPQLIPKFIRSNEDEFPTEVMVQVDGHEYAVLFEHDHRKSPCIRMDPAMLTNLIEDIYKADRSREGEGDDYNAKRSKYSGEYKYREISFNPARKVPCAKWKDADGKWRYYSQPLKDDSPEALDECIEAIHSYYLQHANEDDSQSDDEAETNNEGGNEANNEATETQSTNDSHDCIHAESPLEP